MDRSSRKTSSGGDGSSPSEEHWCKPLLTEPCKPCWLPSARQFSVCLRITRKHSFSQTQPSHSPLPPQRQKDLQRAAHLCGGWMRCRWSRSRASQIPISPSQLHQWHGSLQPAGCPRLEQAGGCPSHHICANRMIKSHADPSAWYSRPNMGWSSRHVVSFRKPGKINSWPYSRERRGRARSGSHSRCSDCLAMAITA